MADADNGPRTPAAIAFGVSKDIKLEPVRLELTKAQK